MEVHIHSVKAKSQPGNKVKESRKPKESQLWVLKIYAFCQKIQQRASVPGESAAGVTYLPMRIDSKSYCIFPLKVAATLLSGSRKRAIGAYWSHS